MTDAVLDTQVYLYALIGVPRFRDEALAVIQATGRAWAPDSMRAELANAVWQWVRSGGATRDDAMQVLTDAESLVHQFVSASEVSLRALDLAIERDHPVYDTLFVAVAEGAGVPLVTYDRRLLERFPGVAVTASAFLA